MSSSSKKKWLLPTAVGLIGGLLLWRKATGEPPVTSPFMMPGPHGTAVVTGASAGIGEAFARQLAALGYHIHLIARRAERLHTLTDELTRRYGVQTTIHTADLTDLEAVKALAEKISHIDDLELLINNAGFGTTGHLHETTLDSQLDMLHLHVDAPMVLTKAALPGMMARRYGGIINVSSVMGILRGAGSVNYSGTKAYLNGFSESLQLEVAEHGLFVQALCPGYTRTEFHDSPEFADFDRDGLPSSLWMTPEAVVRTSLQSLGTGRVVVIPGWRYKLVVMSAQKGFSVRRLREMGRRLGRVLGGG